MKSEQTRKKKSALEQTGEDLFNFAINREDVKWFMAHLADEADINRNTVDYELQILKIISVGWSISYFLENKPQKEPLLALYWEAVREFSHDLSETTGLMIGKDIDYFQILKERLETYVNALAGQPGAREPAEIIGPEFARTCGNAEDLFTFMTGSKMFMATVSSVKDYLLTVKLI